MENRKAEKIGLMSFAHHDLGWHKNSFANETAESNMEINEALDIMRRNPDYKWIQEHGRYVGQYLNYCPERVEELKERVKEGRFELGAGYSSPYTSFVSNEFLVRQFIYGKKWVEETFPGCDANIFYNTDVPGLAMQMPQILKKSGVDYLYASRSWNFDNYKGNELKKWKSPDGSEIDVLFMHHYGIHVGDNFNCENIQSIVGEYHNDMLRQKLGGNVPFLYGQDCIMPDELAEKVSGWNTFAEEKGLPKMEYQTMQEALKKIFVEGADFSEDTLVGEWPNKWFYENAASDNNSFRNQREAARYLQAAETLGVLRAIFTGDFSSYPAEELAEGWRAADHACHGYAPDECIREFREIYEKAVTIGKKLYKELLAELVSHVAADSAKGSEAVVVYNNLSWERTDVVTMEKTKAMEEAFVLTDTDGREIAYQVTADGKIVFVAENIPAFGYKTFYVKAGTAHSTDSAAIVGARWETPFENSYYVLAPGKNGGLKSVIDKEAGNRELFDTSKFQIGELMEFQYDGMGAGEQLNMWQPHSPVRIGEKCSEWSCVESGAVRTVFETKTKTENGTICVWLAVYEQLKKIDFHVAVDNEKHEDARQLRMMFPVNAPEMFGADGMVDASRVKVNYEVPFGKVTVGEEVLPKLSKFNDNTADPNNCQDEKNEGVRPREVQNWIGTEEGDFNVTISSYNIGWDYQDATKDPVKTPVLQPVLMSSSKSCHWACGHWLQPGKTEFHFALTSGNNCAVRNHRASIQTNNPLDAVVQTAKSECAKLPEVFRGFRMDNDHVIITAIKKAEDDDRNIVVRYYEAEGKDGSEMASLVLPEGVEITSAGKLNLIERDEHCAYEANHNTVSVPVTTASIETLRVAVEGIH